MSSAAEWGERQARNDRSRNHADKHGEPWAQYEDDFLNELWVGMDAKLRDEIGVAMVLERTIEACRCRAEVLRGAPSMLHRNSRTTVTISRTTTASYTVCDLCHMVLPASGQCDCR